MGARGETLAQKFEAKVDEATQVFERLSDADWRKTTAAERWPEGRDAAPAGPAARAASRAVDASRCRSIEPLRSSEQNAGFHHRGCAAVRHPYGPVRAIVSRSP